jgi:hypothetical protein
VTCLLLSCFSPPPNGTNGSTQFAQASLLRAQLVEVLCREAGKIAGCRLEAG